MVKKSQLNNTLVWVAILSGNNFDRTTFRSLLSYLLLKPIILCYTDYTEPEPNIEFKNQNEVLILFSTE